MTWTGARATRYIWWIFLLVLIGDTVLVGTNLLRSTRNDAEVATTLANLSLLNRLTGRLVDAESGTRGFVVEGDEQFLAPYYDALPMIDPLMTELRGRFSSDSVQLGRFEQLAPMIQERLRLLRVRVEERQEPVRAPGRDAVIAVQGKRQMDAIRTQLGSMISAEQEHLASRRSASKSAFNTSIFTTLIGGGVTVGVLVLTNYLMRREREFRRRTEDRLRQNEERFRVIAESLPQFVWVARPDGHYEYCNRRWYEYTGLSAEQSLGSGWSGPLHADDRERCERLWKHSLATGTPFEMEYRIRRQDGAFRWFLARMMPLREEPNQITRWLGTGTDIDDQKRAEVELESRVKQRTAELQRVVADLYTEVSERDRATELLRRTTAELERSNGELEQFAYLASHDLQEPLRKIQAFGDRLTLKHGEHLPEQAVEYLRRMQGSATRMRKLIDDLLAYSRVATRPQPHTEVDLNAVVQDVLGDLEDAISRTGATVDVGPLPTIRADAAQMQQLMLNLLTNALKFHKPTEPPVVTVRAATLESIPGIPPETPAQMAVRIEVTDHGIGFDQTYRERIFQVFQRLHGRGSYEGTGIGLAIVRKIVERHGGTVTAESAPGAGATFRVILPMIPRVDEPRPAVAEFIT
jgi:PAS domain S-box-containing protein